MSHTRTCRILGVPDDRLHRWRHRLRTTGTLADRAPDGVALHALLDWEVAATLDLAEDWEHIDRSHRKLAHRSSRLGARVGVDTAPCPHRQRPDPARATPTQGGSSP